MTIETFSEGFFRMLAKKIDTIISAIFARRINIDQDRRYFQTQASEHKESLERFVLRYMDNIDSKSGALLTHVSMMIAVLSIASNMNISTGVKFVLFGEIIAYIFISIGLLRCLDLIGAHSVSRENYISEAIYEASTRRIVYIRCRFLTVIVTFLFFLTFIYHFVENLI